MTVSIYEEASFNCSAETLLKVVMDDAFHKAVNEFVQMKSEILLKEDRPAGPLLRVRVSPAGQEGGFVAKALGDKRSWVENRQWDLADMSNTWTIEPAFRPDKVDIKGTYKIFSEGPARCRRVVEGSFTVNVPLIGGRMEKTIAERTSQGLRTGAQFQERWLREHGLEGT